MIVMRNKTATIVRHMQIIESARGGLFRQHEHNGTQMRISECDMRTLTFRRISRNIEAMRYRNRPRIKSRFLWRSCSGSGRISWCAARARGFPLFSADQPPCGKRNDDDRYLIKFLFRHKYKHVKGRAMLVYRCDRIMLSHD